MLLCNIERRNLGTRPVPTNISGYSCMVVIWWLIYTFIICQKHSYYGDILPYRTGFSHTTSGHNITITIDMPGLEAYHKYIIKPVRQNITCCQGNISHLCLHAALVQCLALITCDILCYRLDNIMVHDGQLRWKVKLVVDIMVTIYYLGRGVQIEI